MNNICFNGKIIAADKPVLLASNRSYRYGDGVFETMKIKAGKILLADYHFERLFSSLLLLKFEWPKLVTQEKLEEKILELCEKNKCNSLARVRLSVFRGNGGLYDDDKAAQYLIECWPLNESVNQLNENGLVIDIYTGAEKGRDDFSNIKSANFLPYSMAALFAKEIKVNDCLVLNAAGGIADSTIANVFLVNGNIISTPSLYEGCINGVMRRHIIKQLKENGYELREEQLKLNNLEEAEEVFLTNAINGIRWVRQFRNKIYSYQRIAEIYRAVF